MEKEDILNEKELAKAMPKGKGRGINRKKIAIISIAIVIILIIAFLILNAFVFKLDLTSVRGKKVETAKEEVKKDTGMFSGKLTLLDKPLGLMKFQEWEGNDYSDKDVSYYTAGVYNSGKYQGYTRVIALKPSVGIGGSEIATFVTNDFISYMLDGNTADVGKYNKTDYQNPLYNINSEKITKVEKIESEYPDKISLDDKFSLYKGNIVREYKPTGREDEYGQEIGKNVLAEDTSIYEEMKNNTGTDLSFFADSSPKKPSYFDSWDDESKVEYNLVYKNTSGKSSIIVKDSAGLLYTYYLGRSDVSLPLAKKEIDKNAGLYDNYGYAFPGGCGGITDTYIAKWVSDNDLEKIGTTTTEGIDLYKPKDKNHALLKMAYEEKTSFMYTGDYKQPYTVYSTKELRPSYDEYVSKTPLLFMKDSWGRWLFLVEYQYRMPGGCGKPVLYFYPTTPTEVSVQFADAMSLTTDIPKYDGGWKVLADVNGNLKDLQPEATICSAIDFGSFGSEYAKEACLTNNYPYIYWAGDTINTKYPELNQGWSVAKSDVEAFLSKKLDYIGLSTKEKKDMMDYWVPELLSKDANYYRISFLQDDAMNKLVPMNIAPNPDNLNRVFLDWMPLNSSINIAPQPLQKINRNGFSIVEWGGLKK